MTHAVRQAVHGGDDAVWVGDVGDLLAVVLADGAGGISGGRVAADLVISRIRELTERGDLPRTPQGLETVLAGLDGEILAHPRAGETTAVLVVVEAGVLVGASVGDSAAWLIEPDALAELTGGQHRKRLGSGRVRPVGFGPVALGGRRLVVASDGLHGFVSPERIRAEACQPDTGEAAGALVESARSSNGAFHDDVTVIVAAAAPAR